MNQWLMLGSVAAGIIVFVYQYYNQRASEYEQSHQRDSSARDTLSEDDFEDISEEDLIRARNHGDTHRLPGAEDNCSICLEPLMSAQGEGSRRYIVSLPKCGHWFHYNCVNQLLDYHPMCPVCRIEFRRSTLRMCRKELLLPRRRVNNSDGDLGVPFSNSSSRKTNPKQLN